MSAFTARRKIRFAHCDPAGIAYYPRLFELCDSVIEDWSDEVLSAPRRELHLEMGLGLPTATLSANFIRPARLGEFLDISLLVVRVGNSSVDLELRASCGGEERFSVQYRQVLFSMESGRSKAWPDEWRRSLADSCSGKNRA